jgi:hypothetical protein
MSSDLEEIEKKRLVKIQGFLTKPTKREFDLLKIELEKTTNEVLEEAIKFFYKHKSQKF